MAKVEVIQADPRREVVLASLVEFLREIHAHSDSSVAPLQIVVHQYGYTPLYAPVYMAFNELIATTRTTENGKRPAEWLSIKYLSAGSDIAAEEQVTKAAGWKPGGAPIIHFGLSEVTTRSNTGAASGFFEQTIVKRLPLWGVAVRNNSKINRLKRKRQSNKASQELVDFWQLFAGKLSLLQPLEGDLWGSGEAGEDLSLSIYREGSTVHRLFTKYLEGSGRKLKKKQVQPVTFDNEFKHLIDRSVDVALTVQPWRALRFARENAVELELVYTHLAKPEPFTSLYAFRGSNNDGIWQLCLDLLGSLVQANIEDLYSGREKILDRAYVCYEEAINGNPGLGVGLESREEFGYAMQVLNDSRVYYYDLASGRGTRPDATATKLQDAMTQALFCYFESVGRRDLVFACSIHAAKLATDVLVDWHTGTPMNAEEYRSRGITPIIEGFKRIASELDVEFKPNTLLEDVRTGWRIRSLHRVLPELIKRCVELKVEVPDLKPWYFENLRIDFSPWIYHKTLKLAFTHFESQFNSDALEAKTGLIPRALKAKVKLLSLTDDPEDSSVAISWLWVEYDRCSNESSKEPQFFHDNLARRLLCAWYVSAESAACTPIFVKQDHGTLILDGNVPTLVAPDGSKTVITEQMAGAEAMLFTFRVAKVRYYQTM